MAQSDFAGFVRQNSKLYSEEAHSEFNSSSTAGSPLQRIQLVSNYGRIFDNNAFNNAKPSRKRSFQSIEPISASQGVLHTEGLLSNLNIDVLKTDYYQAHMVVSAFLSNFPFLFKHVWLCTGQVLFFTTLNRP